MKQLIVAGLVSALGAFGTASAEPIIYTAYAVTDGSLGNRDFIASPVTITFRGDTADLVQANGVPLYRMDSGKATVAVTINGRTNVARIDDGQIYVYYDVNNSVVGFGSYAISPTYPLTLSCLTGVGSCTYGPQQSPAQTGSPFDQIVSAIADVAAVPTDSQFYSGAVNQLPATLAQPTLLTGYISACAVAYGGGSACPQPAAKPIRTDRGDLYLQDRALNGEGIFTVRYRAESE